MVQFGNVSMFNTRSDTSRLLTGRIRLRITPVWKDYSKDVLPLVLWRQFTNTRPQFQLFDLFRANASRIINTPFLLAGVGPQMNFHIAFAIKWLPTVGAKLLFVLAVYVLPMKR